MALMLSATHAIGNATTILQNSAIAIMRINRRILDLLRLKKKVLKAVFNTLDLRRFTLAPVMAVHAFASPPF